MFDNEDRSDDRARRLRLIQELKTQGIEDLRLLKAMERLPRHRFVPPEWRDEAYANKPLPIGSSQTISQPFVVAKMIECAHIHPDSNVLEIGTGSGYQTALLAMLAAEVWSLEIDLHLHQTAKARLEALDLTNARLVHANGIDGWPGHSPYDAVLVSAAPTHVPRAFADQLDLGGRLVIPWGPDAEHQHLWVYSQTGKGVAGEKLFAVRFVPMLQEEG